MIKNHQIIFNKTKTLLKKHFNGLIKEHEEGSYLAIGDTGIWISYDEIELTIGYGLSHKHCDPEFDNIQEAITDFFHLITKRKRITRYYKGEFQFKLKTEIEQDKNTYKYFGTSMTWLYPYWKKTVIKEHYIDRVLSCTEFEHEINEIKNYARFPSN